MPTYQINDKETGIKMKVRGDSPPSEEEAAQLIEQEAGRRGMRGVEGLPTTKQGPDTDIMGRELRADQARPDQSIGENLLFSGKLAAQNMFTMDPERLLNVYEEEFPGARFERTEEGDVIADFTELGGQRGVIEPSREGIAAAALQFTPAGQWATKGRALMQMLRGGVGAGATETARDVASQGLGGIASRIIPGLKGKPVLNDDGSLTDDALQQIRQADVDPAQLDRRVARELQKEGVMTPEQAERFNLFQQQGVRPTRAQVTQSADDFQFQQEQVKTSGPLRQAVDEQDMTLAQRGEDLAERAGGQTAGPRDTGEQVFRAVTRKADDMDDEISRLYRTARERAGTEKSVRPDKMAAILRRNQGRNEVSGGTVKAIREELRQRGLIDSNLKPQGRMDVNQAEEVRQSLNSLYEGANPQGRRIITQAKEALDDDVMRVAGKDVFRKARAARNRFRTELEKAKRSKRDKGTKSTLEDILEGKIEPERISEKLIVNKGGSVRDLDVVKKYLLSGTDEQVAQGQEAWNALRRDAIEEMFDRATGTAGKTEGGQSVFNGNQFDKAMNRIGKDRLRVLFEPEEIKELNQLRDIGKLRIPVSGTQQGKGPTAQAVDEALDRIPGVGALKNIVGRRTEQKAAQEAANPVAETIRAFERARRPNLSGPAATGSQEISR